LLLLLASPTSASASASAAKASTTSASALKVLEVAALGGAPLPVLGFLLQSLRWGGSGLRPLLRLLLTTFRPLLSTLCPLLSLLL
jgi:hypothetical protein